MMCTGVGEAESRHPSTLCQHPAAPTWPPRPSHTWQEPSLPFPEGQSGIAVALDRAELTEQRGDARPLGGALVCQIQDLDHLIADDRLTRFNHFYVVVARPVLVMIVALRNRQPFQGEERPKLDEGLLAVPVGFRE